MATWRSGTVNTSSGSGGSSIAVTRTITAGDLVVVCFTWEDSQTLTSVTDTAGGTWAIATQQAQGAAPAPIAALAYCLNHPGGSATITGTLSGAANALLEADVLCFTPASGKSFAFDAAATPGTGSSSSTFSCGSTIATSASGVVVQFVGGFQLCTGVTTTGSSPAFTRDTATENASGRSFAQYLLSGSAQTVTPGATWGAATSKYVMLAAAFKEASAMMAVETDTALALSSPPGAGLAVETDTALALAGVNFTADGDLFTFGDDTDDESSMGGLRVFGGYAATGTSANVGRADEFDVALTLAGKQILAAGMAAETDTALALAGAQAHTVGIAAETDAALALSATQILAAGMATETDTALALTSGASGAVGVAAETDAALALGAKLIGATGLSAETDVALPLTGVAVRAAGLATETDAALALTPVQIAAAGRADETDTALALLAAGPLPVGMAVEIDEALALTSPAPVSEAGHGAGPRRRAKTDHLELADYGPTEALVRHQIRLNNDRAIVAILTALVAAEIL